MKRNLLIFAVVGVLMLGTVSTVLAHPQDEAGNPGQAVGFGSEPALTGAETASENGFLFGIFLGFVIHSPTCLGHPVLGH